MKLKNVIVYAAIITVVCIGYVSLQVEIIKLSYKLRIKEKRLSEVIDRNRVLLYNNSRFKAPQYLTNMLKENSMDLQLPDTASVSRVIIVQKSQKHLVKSTPAEWGRQFLDVFVPKAQAGMNMRK